MGGWITGYQRIAGKGNERRLHGIAVNNGDRTLNVIFQVQWLGMVWMAWKGFHWQTGSTYIWDNVFKDVSCWTTEWKSKCTLGNIKMKFTCFPQIGTHCLSRMDLWPQWDMILWVPWPVEWIMKVTCCCFHLMHFHDLVISVFNHIYKVRPIQHLFVKSINEEELP